MLKSIRVKVLFSILFLSLFSMYANITNLGYIKDVYDEAIQLSKSVDETEIANNLKSLESTYAFSTQSNRIGIIMIVVISVIVITFITGCVLVPTKKAANNLENILESINSNKGNLSQRIPVQYSDEVGQLVGGINVFLETLQKIMQHITLYSSQLNCSVGTVSESIKTVTENSQNISSLMQQLAANMEEITATVATISEEISVIDLDVVGISESTSSTLTYITEMEKRAKEMKTSAQKNKDLTTSTIKKISITLQEAIEDGKKVENINALTSEILSISSQTNLLALNASIEAARAGEAGKGFAVVADEIRQLADNSKTTATKIQDISQMVTTAVTKLMENSNQMMEFVHVSILPNYDHYLENGIKYNDDASYIFNVMNTFSKNTTQLRTTMDRISDSFIRISSAVDESSGGISHVANNTLELANKITVINKEMQTNKEVALNLDKETYKFRQE